MPIQREEVERIAELARLDIAPDRIEKTAEELSRVLEFVAALDRLDLAGCEPTMFAPLDSPLREDQLDERCLTPEQAVAMAPASENGFFVVPPVVENVNP